MDQMQLLDGPVGNAVARELRSNPNCTMRQAFEWACWTVLAEHFGLVVATGPDLPAKVSPFVDTHASVYEGTVKHAD